MPENKMLLPIEKAKPRSDLQDYSILLHGMPKIGKSTMCSQAEDALFLAFEPGLNALEVYQTPIDNWEHFCEVCKEIAEGKHSFKTIVIDTIGIAYQMCAEYICNKFSVPHQSDLSYGKGPSLVNNEFQRVLSKLGRLPYGLFLIAHTKTLKVESRTGDYTKYVPNLSEGARKIILGMVDIILYCDLDTSTDSKEKQTVRRVMRTKPSQYYEAGDRTKRLPEVIELDYTAFLKAFNQGQTGHSPDYQGQKKP
jgi:hypothetical protein